MKKWNFYTTNEIKPAGWMKRQLELQAHSLSGNLDKVWPRCKRQRLDWRKRRRLGTSSLLAGRFYSLGVFA